MGTILHPTRPAARDRAARGRSPGRIAAGAVVLALAISGCGGKVAAPKPGTPAPTTRTYRMGFSGIPPRDDLALAIAAIDLWSQRADAAILSYELPWDSLLAGVPPESLIARDQLGLTNYFRFKGHRIWLYLDPANGLDRAGESDALEAAGRSIVEPAIQQLFRRYAVVADSMLQPEHMGLALETNLIRGLAPAPLYAAIRQVANDAAADVRARDAAVKLSVSVQVDYAWGRFGGPYQGVEADFADFPFIEELGFSSYPYLANFTHPDSIPVDYYARLLNGRTIPTMVTEGGWTSASLDTLVISSPALQQRYIERQIALLDRVRAIAVFQLTFTDLDPIIFPPGSILPLFAHCGLVDVNLVPKPALGAWDAAYGRAYAP
jgi:hypothetical protein